MSWPLIVVLSLLALAVFSFSRARSLARKRSSASRTSSRHDPETGADLVTGEPDKRGEYLVQIWTGSVEVEFSYLKGGERTRREVRLTSVHQTWDGGLYLRGMCHLRKEERTFAMDKIVTMIKADGKKRHKEAFLREVCGVDVSAIHPDVEALRKRERDKLMSRFTSIWQGSMDISFRARVNEFDEQWHDITLKEVLLSKEGNPYFLEEVDGAPRVQSCYEISSEIKLKGVYRDVLAFLVADLGVDPRTLGIRGLWNGREEVKVTYDGWGDTDKQDVVLASVIKSKHGKVFIVCYREADDAALFIPLSAVTSIHKDGKRKAGKDFVTDTLGVSL